MLSESFEICYVLTDHITQLTNNLLNAIEILASFKNKGTKTTIMQVFFTLSLCKTLITVKTLAKCYLEQYLTPH